MTPQKAYALGCIAAMGLVSVLAGCSGSSATQVQATEGASSPSDTPTPDAAATSTSPTATTPASSTATSTTSPAPAEAALLDLTWVSDQEGWALARGTCSGTPCPQLTHTTDGGVHWQRLPNPPAQLVDAVSSCATATCVSHLRFAGHSVGYLFAPALLMTSDGGRTWQRLSGPQVETLTVSSGTVYRVAYDHTGCPGPCDPSLQSAPVGSEQWQTLIAKVKEPDRSDAADIVTSTSDALLATYGSLAGPVSAQADVYRSTDSGRTWHAGADPCAGRRSAEEDLVSLASAPGGFFAGLCAAHGGGGYFTVTSGDGGATWHAGGALPGSDSLQVLAAATASDLLVATAPTSGHGTFTAKLLRSTDGGQHWTTVQTDRQQGGETIPAWLGFESGSVGRWIGDPDGIWTTTDSGAQWTRRAFG